MSEVAIAEGCACATAECKTAMMGLLTQECKDTMINTICNLAPDIEKEQGVDVRSLFGHILNDCGGGKPSKCTKQVCCWALHGMRPRTQHDLPCNVSRSQHYQREL
jgi:hypothetical protein